MIRYAIFAWKEGKAKGGCLDIISRESKLDQAVLIAETTSADYVQIYDQERGLVMYHKTPRNMVDIGECERISRRGV